MGTEWHQDNESKKTCCCSEHCLTRPPSSSFVQLHGPRDRQSPDSTPLEFLYMGMSLISLSSPSPTQQPLPTNSYSSHIEKWFFSSLQTTSNSTPTRRLLSVVSSLKTCSRVRLHPSHSAPQTSHLHLFPCLCLPDVGESDQPIPLPNVSSSVLKKVSHGCCVINCDL